jgi:ectoine hydroxylase-related dioxygenase (phytanoyl-CoA dioxygenase family)
MTQAFNDQADEISVWADKLLTDGYVTIPNVADPVLLDALYADFDKVFEKTPFCSGDFYGETTKRFGRLLIRSPHTADFVRHELVYNIVDRVLGPWCESLQLNLTQAIDIHPGAQVQAPHRDQEMFDNGDGRQYMINAMWALDDFTADNGPTRLWPGSHRQPDVLFPDEDAILAVMPRGSVTLFLGSTQHSGGENFSRRSRRGMIISYCLGWLKPWENQWLAYPPAIARDFDPDIAALVGYRQHLPSLGNFEGQCPSILLRDDVPDNLAFVDSLRPEQYERLKQYYEYRNGRLAA